MHALIHEISYLNIDWVHLQHLMFWPRKVKDFFFFKYLIFLNFTTIFITMWRNCSLTSFIFTGAKNDKDLSDKLPHDLSQKASSVDVTRSNDTDSDVQCKGVCQRKDHFPITETDEPKAFQYNQVDLIDEPYNVLKLSFKNDVHKMESETHPLQILSPAKHDTFERKRCREAVGML